MIGEVRDSSGAVVPDAKVTATQTEKQLVRVATTAGDGAFVFPSLLVGPYTLKVEKAGFRLYEQSGIVLTVSQVASIPVTLQVGTISQAVNVSGQATMINTSTSTLSRLVNQAQVESLPLNGRQPSALVYLTAGSSNPVENVPATNLGNPTLQNTLVHPSEIAPSINGLRGGGVYFSLDGANNIDTYQVTGGPFPNPDAVQEFRVVTNTYGAEYVSAPSGAVDIVTKSGTNGFHGDLWEFVRNGDLNARNFFAPSHDLLKRNQFGGAAGGPIIKNRLFIFASYEATRIRNVTESNITFLPTAAERAGDFSAISKQLTNPATGQPYLGNQISTTQFNPVSVALLQYLPVPSLPGGELIYPEPENTGENQGVVRVDYARGNHLIMGHYFADDYTGAPAGILNGDIVATHLGTADRWQNVALGDTYTKSANFINEFRLGFVRDYSTTFAGEHSVSLLTLGATGFAPTEFPTIQVLSVTGGFTIDSDNYDGFPRDTWTLSDHVNMLRGRHEISFGFDGQYLGVKEYTDTGQNPTSSFTGNYSGSGMSDFFLGRPFTFSQDSGFLVRARGHLFGFYGQDKIRLSPRLTLTAGLRWDPYFPFHALYGRMTCFRPGQQSQVYVNSPTGILYPGDAGCNSSGTSRNLDNVEPRLGLAYMLDPQGKTVVRAGYGIYTMQFPMFSFLAFGFAEPYSNRFALAGNVGPISNPWANFPGGSPFLSGYELNDLPRPTDVKFVTPVSVVSLPPKFPMPYVQQWSFSLERSLDRNTSVEASYIGTKGTDLSYGADLNQAIYGPGETTANEQAYRPYANISNARMLNDAGNSIFNGFELKVRHRLKGGINLDSDLTLSKSIDIVSSNANGILTGAPNQVPIPSDPNARRGLSDFDISHSWISSVVWKVPFAAEGNRATKALTSDWEFTGIFTLEAGQPFSIPVATGNSLSGNGLEVADRVPGVSPSLSTGRPRGQLVQEYFNTAAFQPDAIGTFGNSGRNILRGPGLTDLDFGVNKPIFSRERYRAVLRAEFFNFTNTPQFVVGPFTNPSTTTVGTSTFGKILTARDPRILQFALKFFW
jgi:hypothetical protein